MAASEIRERIAQKGPITFAEFMEVALYGEGCGYYTSARDRWGEGGDYITSLDVTPVFASLVARQIVEMWEALGSPASFKVVDAGAGRGLLASGILEALKRFSPGLYEAAEFVLIERNPAPDKADLDGKGVWIEDIDSLEGLLEGVIVSNELLDALPFHMVQCSPDGFKEVFVGSDGSGFVEEIGELSSERLGQHLASLHDRGATYVEGGRLEVSLDSMDWIKKAASKLKRGFVITIDYGLPARELYSPERGSTLMCHHRHTTNDEPFERVGTQDITAHVDFTSIALAPIPEGLEPTGFTTQLHFLLGLGIDKEFRDVTTLEDYNDAEREAIRFNQGIKKLIMPGGMGDIFKVLIQHKGVEDPGLLGLSFKNRLDALCI